MIYYSKLHTLGLISIFASILLLALLHMLQSTTIWDDAFITLRVANNWAQTGIPVYNLGQTEWIPTNFLWVALLAGLNKLTLINLPLLSQITGGICGIGIIILLLTIPFKENTRTVNIFAAILCSLSALWAAWPLSGLETSLFSLLITAGVLLIIIYFDKPKKETLIASAILLGMASLTRPEGIVFFIICSFFILLYKRKWHYPGWFALVFGAIISSGILYLLLTFKTILPTSYFVKIHGLQNIAPGMAYLKSLSQIYNLIWVMPIFIFPFLLKNERKKTLFLTMILCGWFACIGIIGGDFMPYHRFISPVWPLLCFYIAFSLGSLMDYWQKKQPTYELLFKLGIYVILGLISLNFILPTFHGKDHTRVQSWSREEADRTAIGKWFRGRYEHTDWVAVKPAGIIPFYSNMNALDFYCLSSRQAAQTGQFVPQHWVGHQKVNVDWVLKQRPRIVILDEHLYSFENLPEPDQGEGIIEREWRKSPLRQNYKSFQIELQANRWLQYFERID